MTNSTPRPCQRRLHRRDFLVGAAAGLTSAGLAYWGAAGLPRIRSFSGRSVEVPKPCEAMPGRYPGRVVEVRHAGSVSADNVIDAQAVKVMIDRGMCELTGADHAVEAWRKFFEPSDVVGIKVNPVGCRRPWKQHVEAISSPAVLLETVAGLKGAGVHPKNIIVFERYAAEFREAGYEAVLRERSMDGIRWFASASRGDGRQVDIEGFDVAADRGDPNVAGYDPDQFVEMGFAAPEHDPKDERRFRSHLSVIVSRMVNKFITIPVLKDHRSAGVTMALKNLSHGLNNNVARSHIGGIHYGGMIGTRRASGPNQCNTFIPAAVNQPLIRQKATLHIMDGLIGVYEGGPGAWNHSWATWRHKSLFFATDPVAMDHVGWDIIDSKRAQEGWQPVAQMGLQHYTPVQALSARLAFLASQGVPDSVSATAISLSVPGQDGEPFDRRQPEHVILAGTIGLGVFDARRIDHRYLSYDCDKNVWRGS